MNIFPLVSLQDYKCSVSKMIMLTYESTLLFMVPIVFIVSYMIYYVIKNKIFMGKPVGSEGLEILWILFPLFILIFIGVPSLRVLYFNESYSLMPCMTVKVIGHQWYWTYEYSDFDGLSFNSYEDHGYLGDDKFRCLDVDNRMVIPYGCLVRLIVTSQDVIHSWAVPSLGIKIDANPGRLNQVFVLSEEVGTFFGQCSEICGYDHSNMPICVESVPENFFVGWVNSLKG